jgi:hypothetical protein
MELCIQDASKVEVRYGVTRYGVRTTEPESSQAVESLGVWLW